MNKPAATAAILAALVLSLPLSAQAPSFTIQADHPIATVSPTFYGLMTEEINFSYDGGIYGELVRDRTPSRSWDALNNWPMVARGNSLANVSLDESTGPSAVLTRSLRVTVSAATPDSPAGVENAGYWGIPVRPRSVYSGSFYAKTDEPGLSVSVSLQNDQTGVVAASATVTGLTGEWKQFTYSLKTGDVPVSSNNHLILTIARPATVWFNLISLFPPTYHARPGGNRTDIMNLLAAMQPKFLRLPGGNYLEGDHIADRFDWKKTIGPWTDRPTHQSPWRYRSSDGMGLLEFLEWCEDLKMEPLLAVYAGYSLAQDHVDPGPALEPYVQEALDEIEYVTGGADTKWGAERIKDGHPAPFPLHYIEVGNEDQFDHSHSYDGRFAQFYHAIKQRYPNLQIIATTPVKGVTPDVLDEHFYMSARESFSQAHHYDAYERKGPKIFVGEWATREGDPTPNLQAALADAAWLTGLERNSDLIIMASYAPLFVNVNPGGMQWATDLIGYDALTSYGSPSYWAQVMFSTHLGTEVIASTLDNAPARVYASVTRDNKKHKLFVKVVNATSTAQPLAIALTGVAKVAPLATLTTMSGKTPNATNSITHPDAVKPMAHSVAIAGPKFTETFAPYSVNVLELSY
ncbi:MAG: alpha-L-arabinofuranosidase C-terminal domain-containing protein [Terracidiphilus sp.]|nr:alpha-L-arabinofuranosidase C-terminal domain-containing protein [Terracidiphilus sp.]MDR3799173.1 alpha-L-arabinofuranosidase C-terminal domain-containing protein [Terracidiphilus sp.]